MIWYRVCWPKGRPQQERGARRCALRSFAAHIARLNAASAREKSIRHGHPSTLHLWWARRPLAAPGAHTLACASSDVASSVEITRTSAITVAGPATLAGNHDAGSYGTAVAITGSTVLAAVPTNADSDLSKVGLVIPASAGVGARTIGAIGKSSHAFTTTRYTVTP